MMSFLLHLPRDARQYFTTLPKSIQESILQSGMRFENKEALKTFVQYWEQRS